MFVELLAGDAGLDDAIEILGMHREHAVHVAKVEADAAARRVYLTLERGALAEADHRHAMRRAQSHDLLHLFGALRKHHRVRRLVLDPCGGVAVLLAQRLRGRQPIAVARRQRRDYGGGGLARFAAAFGGLDQSHYCSCLSTSNVAAATGRVKPRAPSPRTRGEGIGGPAAATTRTRCEHRYDEGAWPLGSDLRQCPSPPDCCPIRPLPAGGER